MTVETDTAILHVLISALTLIIVPLMLWVYQRNVVKREQVEKERMDDWRKSVADNFENILKKVTSLCSENHREHDELYTARNKHEKQLESIETIHHQRGCDQPHRRAND
jgi:dsDNA-binding SOS-regulon protein